MLPECKPGGHQLNAARPSQGDVRCQLASLGAHRQGHRSCSAGYNTWLLGLCPIASLKLIACQTDTSAPQTANLLGAA
jgi:hypothetical protein